MSTGNGARTPPDPLQDHHLQARAGTPSLPSTETMLKLLKLKNIALIHAAELELGPGLTLLTGETGGGKSIPIDARALLLGARASADLIRTGEDLAVVEALIESSDARAALE